MKTEHSSAFMQMSGWSSRGSATPQSSSSDSSNSGPGSERSMVNLCQMAVIIEESERETMGGAELKEKTGHQNKEREATRSRWIVDCGWPSGVSSFARGMAPAGVGLSGESTNAQWLLSKIEPWRRLVARP
jgi:hypothetical protein